MANAVHRENTVTMWFFIRFFKLTYIVWIQICGKNHIDFIMSKNVLQTFLSIDIILKKHHTTLTKTYTCQPSTSSTHNMRIIDNKQIIQLTTPHYMLSVHFIGCLARIPGYGESASEMPVRLVGSHPASYTSHE